MDTFYKITLQDVESMKKKGIENIYLRTRKLVAVFEDNEFREVGGDDYEVAGRLDKYVNDTALTFLELRCVLESFPNREQWEKVPLRTLYAQAYDKQHPPKVKPIKQQETADRPAVNMSQFHKMEREVRETSQRCVQVVSELDQLRAENRELREENARLLKIIADSGIETSGAEENTDIARCIAPIDVTSEIAELQSAEKG